MGIFLRHSYNIPPPRWGSFADVQYAIKINAETIYGANPDKFGLIWPLFWGLPITDFSKKGKHGNNAGAYYHDGSFDFDGVDDKITFTLTNFGKSNSALIRVKFRGSILNTVLIGHTSYIVGGYFLFIDATDLIYSANGAYVSVAHGLSINRWYSLAVTRDGTTVKFYQDGKQLGATQTLGSNLDIGVSSVGSYNVGGHPEEFPLPGFIKDVWISNDAKTSDQIALFNDLLYGLYQPVSRKIYLLPTAPSPTTKFYDLNTEISGGSESIQDLTTDVKVNAESFFDLQTEISATTVHTISDLNTEISAAFNISFEDLNTDIQTIAESLTDLNTEITANSGFVFYDLSSEIAASALILSDLNTEVITKAQLVSDLNTDIQAKGDTFYDLNTEIRAKEYLFYDLNTEISVIRSKYWLDTEIEALSYARWSFNTEWNPNRFLNTEIEAKKPYTFSFKTKTGSSYVASSPEIEILLSGYSWPLRTLFLDYLRVGTSNVYNFELWWARGQSGKNPLKNAKIKAEYVNTQFAGGYEVVTCDWLTCTIDGGGSQTINATPLDLGDMPCDSKLDIELTVDCRDCSLTRGLVFFRLTVTGDYKEAIYGAPVVYGDGAQYFEGSQDDYTSNNFICRLYVVG